MDNPSRRLFPRNDCRIPVRYQIGEASTFCEATVCNRSKTGLYLEAGELLPPQANIRIVIPADEPETADHREYPCYFGQTVWSRLLRNAPTPQIGCGVHLLRRRDTAAGEDARVISQPCERCGEQIACCDICRIGEGLYVCPPCHQVLFSVVDEGLRNSIIRILMGNVL